MVRLSGNGIQLSLVVQPSILDFGDTLINTTSTKSVTLINRSTVPVTGIGATLAGADEKLFTVVDAPTTLAAGASALVHISFAPNALEIRSLATATFEGSDKETATLNLFGEPIGVAFSLAPNPINFGYVPLQTLAVACTNVTNQANVTVNVLSVINFLPESNAFGIATTDELDASEAVLASTTGRRRRRHRTQRFASRSRRRPRRRSTPRRSCRPTTPAASIRSCSSSAGAADRRSAASRRACPSARRWPTAP